MEVVTEEKNGILVMRLKGRVDSSRAGEFEREMLQPIDAGAMQIIADLSELEFISSAGLRVLLLAAKRTKAKSGTLSLCSVTEPVREVLQISGFLRLFGVYENEQAAIGDLS